MAAQRSDMELLQEYAIHGAQEAFAQLVQRRVDLVYSAALRQVRDSHLAQDVTQAVFVVLARKAKSLEGSGANLAGWLMSATHWVALDALRKLARQRKHERKAAQMTPEAAENQSPDDETWARLTPCLDAALARLREGDRAAIVLRYFEHKSMREVADELGISEAAAKQRVFRAVEKLRKSAGGALSAGAVGAAIAAHAVASAPAGLAQAAAASALAAAPQAIAVAALVKGAIWIMAINKLKISIITLILLGLAIPTAVVTYHWINSETPPIVQKPASNPAPPVATATAPVIADSDWRTRFAQVYHLDDGQVLKHIAPPFIPERSRYLKERKIDEFGDMQNGISFFQWENNRAEWNRWTGQSPTVENVLRFCAQLPRYKIQMDDFDRMRPLEGDWVVRSGASEEDRVAAIAKQILFATEWPVHFEKRMIEREVFVARGKYNPTTAPPSPGEPPMIHLYLDKHGQPSNRSVGSLAAFLVSLGEIIDTEIIDETGNSNRDGVYWSNYVSGGVAGAFREKLLKNVATQTGMTFTPDRRKCEVWIAVANRL